jgi:hypothetical protein
LNQASNHSNGSRISWDMGEFLKEKILRCAQDDDTLVRMTTHSSG